MMFLGRVAAVSYLNTIPFLYGIEHSDLLSADLLLSPPNRCADNYISGKADIALIPTGAIPILNNTSIIDGYCIGASKPVRSVTVMTDAEPTAIRRLFLDSHSITSALLVKIICDEYWSIEPQFIHMADYSVADKCQPEDAFLFIGDKVFDYEGRFRHCYDLSEIWMGMTGLPFVFAAWVAKDLDEKKEELFRQALRFGIDHIPEAIKYYGHSGKKYAYDYLTSNIDFLFDEQKKRALSLFWEKGRKFDPRINPG